MMSRKLRLSSYGSYNPSYANVSLLLHGDGTNGSTTFTDNSPSPKTLTVNGNTQINTTTKKYGTGSIAFDGTGDYLSSAFNTAFDLLPNSFTVETWIYTTNLKAGGQRIFATSGGLPGFNGTNGIHVLCQINDAAGSLGIQMSTNTVTPAGTGSGNVIVANTWTHLAFVYNSSTAEARIFANGTVVAGAVLSGVARPTTNPQMSIATIPGEAGSVTTNFQGYMDDFQLTKGVAKYNMSFSPPLKQYPNS